MIKFEEAHNIIENLDVKPVQIEEIDYMDSVNRVLAEDVFSDMNMPPFDKSAVDGFACKQSDIDKALTIIETIAAGQWPEKIIENGTCARIMTGAPVPKGADIVLMIEDCEEIKQNQIRYLGSSKSGNICFLGEDIQANDVVIPSGIIIKPQHIAVMASVGKTKISVYEKLRVAVLSTGDELVEPSILPAVSQIRNSNSWQLMSQIQRAGAEAIYFGIVADNEKDTRAKLSNALTKTDIVFISGGVSAGDFDYVPLIMKELGFEILFDSIAVQPGRPTTLALANGKFIFGLPGNPVSSFVQFELLGKKLIYKFSAILHKDRVVKCITGKTISRKKAKRKSFYPVKFNADGEIMPLEYHGSAHINSLNDAEAVIAMEIGEYEIQKGVLTDVRFF